MYERGWVLSADTDIFALTDELVEASTNPMREAIHREVFTAAINYRDMMMCGDENVQAMVLDSADKVRPRVSLLLPSSYWILAVREHTEDLRYPYNFGSQMRLSYKRLFHNGIHTGEYILIATGMKEGLESLVPILGSQYIRYAEGTPVSLRHVDEGIYDFAELDSLTGPGHLKSLTTKVLGYEHRLADVLYLAGNDDIDVPSREERARSLTKTIIERSRFNQDFDTLYPEVLRVLPEITKQELVNEITKRRRERLEK